MARVDQYRRYLETWLKDAELRDDGSLYMFRQLANHALASRNASRIYEELVRCLAGDRYAVQQAARNREVSRRRAGGRKTGTKQTADADKRWAPHRAQYKELLNSGKSQADALAIVGRRMGTSRPSDKTLRKQLRNKSEPS